MNFLRAAGRRSCTWWDAPARKSFFIGSALKALPSVNQLDFSVDARKPLRLRFCDAFAEQGGRER
jgi:hypothetical protein